MVISWWFHGDLVGISWWFSGDIMVDLVGRWWDLLWYEWYFISTLDYGYILLFLKIHGYNPTLPWVCGISRADLLGIPRQPMGSKWRQQPGNDDRVERDDESQGRWNHQPKWYWLHKSIRVVSLFFPCGDSYVCKDIYIYRLIMVDYIWVCLQYIGKRISMGIVPQNSGVDCHFLIWEAGTKLSCWKVMPPGRCEMFVGLRPPWKLVQYIAIQCLSWDYCIISQLINHTPALPRFWGNTKVN